MSGIHDFIVNNLVLIDSTVTQYFVQNRCVNMIAHLFHAPVQVDETAIGVGTVGSSEAIMLAGLAFKRKWQARRRSEGKPCDKPNIVTGANVQVCLSSSRSCCSTSVISWYFFQSLYNNIRHHNTSGPKDFVNCIYIT